MKVIENKIDELNLQLTLEIEGPDYAEIKRKKIAERRRTAEFKGFRKGMVPTSLIERVYGEQCLVESVNQVISEGLEKHISDNKLDVLCEPMAAEKQPEVEWVDGKNFSFVFDVALRPVIIFEVEKSDSVPSYEVSIEAKDKEPMKESLKKYYEEKKEEKSEEDLDKEVTERLESQYKNEAEWRLSKDIRDYFVQKAGVKIPEDFLKRWLVANNEKLTAEEVEKQFEGFAADFKWQLVRNFLMSKFELKVEEADIREAAKAYVSYQYAMYGLGNVPEEMLNEAVVSVLQDRRQLENIVEQVEDQKVFAKLKETITLKPTKLGVAEFRELK